jgi:hypothetical protein
MNPRVLELLKNPKNIQPEDIHLLRGEIDAFPYIQNIRALHLYGVHLYERENYQKELSTTAAYTTDKKILYQLINGKIQQKPKPKVEEKLVPENKIETDLKEEAPKQNFYQNSSFPLRRDSENGSISNDGVSCDFQSAGQEATYLYVNGEKNRILFEGEENFLTEENTHIITLDADSLNTANHEVFEEIEESEPETIIQEQNIESEPVKEEILEEQDVSFQEIETLQPDVQIESNEESEAVVEEIEVKEEDKAIEAAEFTPEKIIDEDKISTEKENIQDKEELSFHGMESFLPEVKIQANNAEEIITEISQPNINKHEDEMRRLIEEVEKKMKEKAASEKIIEEEPKNTDHGISFADTQSFETTTVVPEEEVKLDNIIIEAQPEIIDNGIEQEKENIEEKPVVEEQAEVRSAWKPMSFESNLPDSLLNKPVETANPKIEIPQETIPKKEEVLPEIEAVNELVNDIPEQKEEPVEEAKTEEETLQRSKENKEDVPVMNVSFFSSNWTIAQPEKEVQNKEEEKEEKIEEALSEVPKKNLLDSNVPGFINTWQSWLKIDRVEDVEEVEEKEETEIKTKAIEVFIENNPKISQLREESSYVVKEKNDDISHLMTETLATLYFEQKLYTKAIKAFEILIKKNPEKEEYFKNRIQEIKDFRSKN